MNFLLEILSVKGNVSSVRVMGLICVITACAISIMGVYLGRDLTALGILVGALLVPAFGGKVLQKKQEEKGANNEVQSS